MAEAEATTPRARYRARVREEIKEHAWEQIATAGASALSLNAIAKEMGMSGPALYRYFANRDELITALIRDAYRGLADAFAARAEGGTDPAGLADTLRAWALESPHRYLLVYGTPVPGYEAPADTVRITSEMMSVLLEACAGAETPADSGSADVPSFDAYLAEHRSWAPSPEAPPSALRRALVFWTRLHGVLSLELAGHFTGMGFDPAVLYAAEARALTEGR
ncbi:TetR/AcrR family transcriptional regulator [Streptomyces sp. PTM05]|uniref:TetR/AcrR family transcriptional regulator n=1 Tax=Streptantibioticus parmotrematis TaxID=2873249 RepID=A0ABS7R1B2_9ACTN|nr:TetR/AcrR family transcriptional regulator [Streptantibioticus parmotrematis]MBY8887807.1 TetR/AcrR family transcriptional regulator [Streptantibioticus parmotrematis]